VRITANIRNRNTRRACAHAAGYIDELTRARSAPTAKERL
jgi:hypothetical protein